MRATTLMALAVILHVVKRWSTPGETAVDTKAVVGGAFAILVIAMLDQGRTEEIALGFAWIFLFLAAYQAIGPIAKAAKGKTTGSGPVLA